MKPSQQPLVSIIVANYNCAPYIERALASALNQTVTNIEVLFVDDCSTDNSVAVAERLAQTDARLTVIPLRQNGGPAKARNAALERAKGEWVAILDSDDMMHPSRLERLHAYALETDSDIVADDLLVFYDDRKTQSHCFLGTECFRDFSINTLDYIRSNHLSGPRRNSYGFLKPLIRKSRFDEHGIRYNESLDNSEDYELILQLLLRGASYNVFPFPGYFYRKRSSSISHRLDQSSLLALIDSDVKIAASLATSALDIQTALEQRRRSIHNALDLLELVEALKSKHPLTIARQWLRKPLSPLLLKSVIRDKWQRRRTIQTSTSPEKTELGITLVCSEPPALVAQSEKVGLFSQLSHESERLRNFHILDLKSIQQDKANSYGQPEKQQELTVAIAAENSRIIVANDSLAERALGMALLAGQAVTITESQSDERPIVYPTVHMSIAELVNNIGRQC